MNYPIDMLVPEGFLRNGELLYENSQSVSKIKEIPN